MKKCNLSRTSSKQFLFFIGNVLILPIRIITSVINYGDIYFSCNLIALKFVSNNFICAHILTNSVGVTLGYLADRSHTNFHPVLR